MCTNSLVTKCGEVVGGDRIVAAGIAVGVAVDAA
jgi:hypothetical protein